MVQNIGSGREAIQSALARMQARVETSAGNAPKGDAEGGSFADALKAGVTHVDETLRRTEGLHLEVLEGKLDIHEVAAQLKESELSFEFALQVRNKLLDAYREVMRMTV